MEVALFARLPNPKRSAIAVTNRLYLAVAKQSERDTLRKPIGGNKMRLRFAIAILLAMQVLSMAAVGLAAEDQPIIDRFDFTETLKPWAAGASDKDCLTKETLLLQEEIGMGPVPGNRYAALTRDCGGAVWMVARFALPGRAFDVSFDARNLAGCQGCIPLVYVGRSAPSNISQFGTDFELLGDGWQAHKITAYLGGPDKPGPESVYVAIGFTNLDLERPDVKQSAGFDNVRITVGAEDNVISVLGGCDDCVLGPTTPTPRGN
jgi:hypothetical protein